MGVYVLECEPPLALRENESARDAFLLACYQALEGNRVWDRRKIESVPFQMVSSGNYVCEIFQAEEGNAMVNLRPLEQGARGFITSRRGREVKQITGSVYVTLSAKDRRKEKNFYFLQYGSRGIEIKAIVCCSTL